MLACSASTLFPMQLILARYIIVLITHILINVQSAGRWVFVILSYCSFLVELLNHGAESNRQCCEWYRPYCRVHRLFVEVQAIL